MNENKLIFNKTIKELTDVLGEEVCNKIINAYNKQSIYIPTTQSSKNTNELVELLGIDAFNILSYYFGGLIIYIPGSKRKNDRNNKIINDFYKNGLTSKEIGIKYNLSQRSIQSILKNEITNK